MFDAFLKWDGFLFPKIAKLVYYIGLAVIAIFSVIGALGSLIAGMAQGSFIGGLFMFIVALIGGLVGLIVWRVTMELWIVLFSINDTLKDIKNQKSGL